MREFAAFLKPEETRILDKFVFELPCNWKFVPEDLMDIHHVGVIHGSSFGAHFPSHNFCFNLQKHGYNAQYESYTMAPGGAPLFDTMPSLKGKVDQYFACAAWVRPIFNLFGRHDLIQPWAALPLGPERTQITLYTQLPAEFFGRPALKEKNQVYADFIRLVAEEDSTLMESLQNAARSRHYTPGPMAKLERAIHHLLNYWLDSLFGENDASTRQRLSEGALAYQAPLKKSRVKAS